MLFVTCYLWLAKIDLLSEHFSLKLSINWSYMNKYGHICWCVGLFVFVWSCKVFYEFVCPTQLCTICACYILQNNWPQNMNIRLDANCFSFCIDPLSDSFYIFMFSLALVNILENIFWLLLCFTKVEETLLDLHGHQTGHKWLN